MSNPFDEAIKADKAEAKRLEAEEKKKRRHYVTIYVRGCDTTRDCYCLNTNGFDHNEWDSPWIVDMEGNFEGRRGGKEQPLEFPFRKGEDLSEYRERMARREAWEEGYEQGMQDEHDQLEDNGDDYPNPYA